MGSTPDLWSDSDVSETTPVRELMRPAIHRSWRRCSLGGVDRERGTLFQGSMDVELDAELHGVAAPVLAKLEDELGVPALIVLSDAAGRFIRLGAPESAVLRRFEDVGAYPGASAGEELVGTNAIGTALEEGQPLVVVGNEHYQQGFDPITCAAALVRNPLTRRTVGSIALAALNVGAGDDMLPLVLDASRAVERRLLERASAADRLVLEALKARGGGAHRSVVGVSRDMLIANEPGMRLLPRLDQAALWERARETVETGKERIVEVTVGSDSAPLFVKCLPVCDADVTVGALIDCGCGEPGSLRRRVAHSGDKPGVPARMSVAELLVGRSREARYLNARIEAAAESNGAVLVTGEPGTGKAAVAKVVLAHRFPGLEAVRVNCSDVRADKQLAISTDAGVPVIFTHVELLSTTLAYRLRDALRREPELQRSWTATMNTTTSPLTAECLADVPLVDEFGGPPLEVPALRYRRDDIALLVEHFGNQARIGSCRFSLEAMQLLLRYPWPANIRELKNVVQAAIRSTHRDIELGDLPANISRLATRRPLTPLEQAEADAILAAMRACGNNKVQAAAMLQISRSRLYRKASAYGLVGAVLG